MSTANTLFIVLVQKKFQRTLTNSLLTRLTGTPDKTKGQNQIDSRRSRQGDGPTKIQNRR